MNICWQLSGMLSKPFLHRMNLDSAVVADKNDVEPFHRNVGRLTELAFSRAAPPDGRIPEGESRAERGNERGPLGCNAELGRRAARLRSQSRNAGLEGLPSLIGRLLRFLDPRVPA